MRAILKDLHSPDIDLKNYWPKDEKNFGFLLQAFIGPDTQDGTESFDIMVCTPEWLRANSENQKAVWGLHYLIVMEYDLNAIKEIIIQYLKHCTGNDWQEIARKISYIGKWEFQDYTF